MILVDAYQNPSLTEKEVRFNTDYKAEYNSIPTIASRYAYEAVYLYKRAVEESDSVDTVKVIRSIINFNSVSGIADDYKFDSFGDVSRKNSLFKIVNGGFELLE